MQKGRGIGFSVPSVLWGLVLAFLLSSPAAANDKDNLRNLTVAVETISTTASGVLIGGGLILTVSHAAEGQLNPIVEVAFPNGIVTQGEIVLRMVASDWMVVRVTPALAPHGAPLDCRKPHMGETVTTLGHPLGNYYTISSGIVASESKTETYFYLLSIPITFGNSGGAVFDADGNVIGLIKGIVSAAYPSGQQFSTGFVTMISMADICPVLKQRGLM